MQDLYRDMRDFDPVSHDRESGAWNVYRYQDVARVLSDHHTFSSDFGAQFPDRADLLEGNIVAMDPPRHDQLRGLVSQAFTPRAIARVEGRIAQLTEELLDAAGSCTRLELVRDLAYPLPVTVIAELLGVPSTDRPRFREWADALLSESNLDPSNVAAVEATRAHLATFHEYLQEHVTRRRAGPRDGSLREPQDLLSDLVLAEIDGQRLQDSEIVGFATVLLLAGHITTTLLLGNTMLCLDEYPRAQTTLRACPGLIPTAIEEVLRYRSPVPRTARVTTREVELGGQTIPARELVHVWLASANHDERQFNSPAEFAVDRQPNAHVGFGRGIHFCIGAPLARLEARIAVGVLLRRFSSIRIDRKQPLQYYARFNGVRALNLLVRSD
jgi:cytochrome P450